MKKELAKIDIKTQDYIESVLSSKPFQSRVKNIRKKFGIPRRGFDLSFFDELVVKEANPRIVETTLDQDKYVQTIKEVIKENGLSSQWFTFMNDYVQFRFIGDLNNNHQIIILNLGNKDKLFEPENSVVINNYIDTNPVAILIPPYASIREILDFITKNSVYIEGIQKKYKPKNTKIGKTRRKNPKIKERDGLKGSGTFKIPG